MPHKVGNGAILGIVSEDGLPSQKRVTLIDRSDMTVVRRTMSDEYGAYAFTGLNVDTDDYILFTVDDDGPIKKAAMLYDYVKPIPAHQGGFYWSNWFYLSSKKEPVCSIMPMIDVVDASPPSLSYGTGRNAVIKNAVNFVYNEPSITPSAQSIPALSVETGFLRKTTLNNQNYLGRPSVHSFSFEWVLDASKPMSNKVSLCLFTADLESPNGLDFSKYNYKSGMFAVDYIKTTNTVVLRRNSGGEVRPSHAASLDNGLVNAISYVLTEDQRNKPIHISGSIVYGGEAKLFINGVTVETASLSGTPSRAIPSNGVLGILTVGSTYIPEQSIDTNTATFTTSLAVAYAEAMTEAEALDHYQALVVDRIPVLTGYMKSVIEDYPIYFYRLQDSNESAFLVDSLKPLAKTGNPSKLLKTLSINISSSTESAVTGGTGIVFSGGACSSGDLFAAPTSKNSATVEFFARPDLSGSGWQKILSMNSDSLNFFEVEVNATNGLFRLVWRESGAYKYTNFTIAADPASIHHYAFSVNKTNASAKFFVDGLMVESISIPTIVFDRPIINTVNKEWICIGGIPSLDRMSVASPYYGYLAEVAMYPTALSGDTIKKHYDARLIL